MPTSDDIIIDDGYPISTGINGEEDTTHAQGEEDPATTAPAGEEDVTFGAGPESAFGSY